MIQKNGGCPHMVCFKCKYEFCWTCMGHYRRYRHDEGMEKYCGQSRLAYAAAYGTAAFLCAAKLLMSLVPRAMLTSAWSMLPSLSLYSVFYGLCVFVYAHATPILLAIGIMMTMKLFSRRDRVVQVLVVAECLLVPAQCVMTDFQSNAI